MHFSADPGKRFLSTTVQIISKIQSNCKIILIQMMSGNHQSITM